ncbi:MAG: CsiV family protein [Tatlockia sp.]|jgi:hypothetical protein
MIKLAFSLVVFLFAGTVFAKEPSAFYQIDLIVFTHEETPETASPDVTIASPNRALALNTERSHNLSPYHLLPISSSQLKEEYWALHRKPQYRVLMNYTWLQPLESNKAIVLPKISHDGWEVEGNIKIQRLNYYVMDTQLLLTHANTNQNPFVFAQKQRLRGGEIYYFDHPQAGMLIKVHQLKA